ncbi:MAG: DUF4364 family protein [Clostridium sp.]
MFETSSELAENKLLLLYILETLKRPISNSQLTDIILENNLINYFTLQQYVSELEGSDFIKYEDIDEKKLLTITPKGNNVLSFFKDRISSSKMAIIDNHIKEKLDAIKKELTLYSDYTLNKDDSFLVHVKAIENDTPLIDLKLNLPTKKQAQFLCSKWKEDPSEIYTNILSLLFKDFE